MPAWVSAAIVASTAPSNDGSPPRAIAVSRASTSASTLSDFCSSVSTSSATGADVTVPSTSALGGAVPGTTALFPSPSSFANASPACCAGSDTRAPSCWVGSMRPPSSISGLIGVMLPAAMSPSSQPGARPGPR